MADLIFPFVCFTTIFIVLIETIAQAFGTFGIVIWTLMYAGAMFGYARSEGYLD